MSNTRICNNRTTVSSPGVGVVKDLHITFKGLNNVYVADACWDSIRRGDLEIILRRRKWILIRGIKGVIRAIQRKVKGKE